jgi:hypothetical protein
MRQEDERSEDPDHQKVVQVLEEHYPHLHQTLTEEQRRQIAEIVRRYRLLKIVRKRIGEFETVVEEGQPPAVTTGPGRTMEEYEKLTTIEKKFEAADRIVYVATEQVLDDSLVPQAKEVEKLSKREQFDMKWYGVLTAQPTTLHVNPAALPDRPSQFITLRWGEDQVELTHKGGVVHRSDLSKFSTYREGLWKVERHEMERRLELLEEAAKNQAEIDRLEREIGVVGRVSMQDCSENQREIILKAHIEGVDYARKAIRILSGKMSEKQWKYVRGTFHTDWGPKSEKAYVQKIIRYYRAAIRGAGSDFSYECDSDWNLVCDSDTEAYSPGAGHRGSNNIHICPNFFSVHDLYKPAVLIEEWVHGWPGAPYDIYISAEDAEQYRNSSPEVLTENGPSYQSLIKKLVVYPEMGVGN